MKRSAVRLSFVPRPASLAPALASFWREHGSPLLLFAVLGALLSWPTIWNFTSQITSDGIDAKHNLWIFWHTTEALAGRQPLFAAPLLYYPYGISLLVHGVGPLTSLFALPFWPLGPAAAYNGALLVGLALTGYCMYLLGRELGFERSVAFFCGIVLMSSSICLAGLASHVTKVFLGALPLILLALHRALSPQRSPWWAALTGLALLLTPLHTGYQFVFACFALAFLSLAALLAAENRAARLFVLRRLVLTACACLLITGPLLVAIVRAAGGDAIGVDVNRQSFAAPDLAQLVLPPHLSALFGNLTRTALAPYANAITLDIETSVSLSLPALALGLLACFVAPRPARRWMLLGALAALLCLGPSLHWLGRNTFSEYKLPIILPYAFLTGLPGLDFMRAPGRWMALGFVAFAAAAGFGLHWLCARFPRWHWPLVAAAIGLVLLEAWPAPFPQEALPPVPAFYQQIAHESDTYGVFDLPLKTADGLAYGGWGYIHTSSFHQYYQIYHGKGIVAGYISRTYRRHPVFADLLTDMPSALSINGQPSQIGNFQQDLARAGYRYVVLHKTLNDYTNEDARPGIATGQQLLNVVYGNAAPLVDDALVRVHSVSSDEAALHIRAGSGWRYPELQWRWAASPAALLVESPVAQPALLQITPAFIHDPQGENNLGTSGRLLVQVGSYRSEVTITADQAVSVPLPLVAGSQTISLTLATGNFAQPQVNGVASEPLSFAVRSIDLQTGVQIARPSDILLNGATQQGEELLALHGDGWYEFDAQNQSRWANSPAEVLIYSATQQQIQLELSATTLFNGSDGLGEQGTLRVAPEGGPAQEQPVRVGKAVRVALELQPGWNRFAVSLAAGNFQPSALFPGNGDQRQLSFVLNRINIVTQ